MRALSKLEENHKGEATEQDGSSNTMDCVGHRGRTCQESKVIGRGTCGTRKRHDQECRDSRKDRVETVAEIIPLVGEEEERAERQRANHTGIAVSKVCSGDGVTPSRRIDPSKLT